MVVCALWVGCSKPDMNILLKPMLQTINQLNVLGFTFSEPDRGVITIRVKLLFAVNDFDYQSKNSQHDSIQWLVWLPDMGSSTFESTEVLYKYIGGNVKYKYICRK